MSVDESQYISRIAEVLRSQIHDQNVVNSLANQVYRGVTEGLELETLTFDEWFDNRFKYQLVWLTKDDYVKALTNALWLAPVFAGTDFGSSRQRDMAQVWTDTARGFLGEIALSRFLSDKFGARVKTDFRRGELEEFLPSDITGIMLPDSGWIEPRLKLSIKTTKFNGRWLDAPGAQLEHSDVFVLVKIGIMRHHFLAFLKAISFLKDKLFPSAADLGVLNSEQAEQLWNELPTFDPIPAYIAGYIKKDELNLPIHMLNAKLRGRKTKRIVISQGIGLFSKESLRSNAVIQQLDPEGNLDIEIEPIIDSLTGQHFLAHSGGLKYGKHNWRRIIGMLSGRNAPQ